MKDLSLFFLATVLWIFLGSCEEKKPQATNETTVLEARTKTDTYYHYSIWWAFVNKVFNANLSVETLKEKGDIGLGSFNLLDGEMVMVDGIPYRIREDGKVSVGMDSDTIVYANATFFKEDKLINISSKNTLNVEDFKTKLNASLPSPNYFYAFKITGTFDHIKCGGLNRQEPPFEEGLDVLIPNRPVFEGQNVSGTIIGFYCPDFIGNINVKGYHFHFISDDKSLGGHVMDFKTTKSLQVGIDKKTDYHFVLPENQDFEGVGFDKEFQYQK